MKIGVICSRKISNAAICESLEKNHCEIQIARYQIPLNEWIPWLLKRVKDMGFYVLFGHLLLSVYLRTERTVEKIFKRPLWLKYRNSTPSWNNVKGKIKDCFSESSLSDFLKEVDLVVVLDQFRLTHRFYRQIDVPIIEVIWGITPDYMGDSGSFWAYTQGDKDQMGVTLVLRTQQFDRLEVIEQIKLKNVNKENIRSIKIQQVVDLEKKLWNIIKNISNNPQQEIATTCRIFKAPTIFTYIKFLFGFPVKKLPSYAYKKSICYLKNLQV